MAFSAGEAARFAGADEASLFAQAENAMQPPPAGVNVS